MSFSKRATGFDFKILKFCKYDGTENPKMHFKMSPNKFDKSMDEKSLLVQLFLKSLEGNTLNWYSNMKFEKMKTLLDLSTNFVR
mgnify:CR=1 FL=1